MLLHQLLGYVGPGPGLTMLWAFIALLGTILLSVLYLLIWPLRALIRRTRGPAADGQTPAPAADGDPGQPAGAAVKGE